MKRNRNGNRKKGNRNLFRLILLIAAVATISGTVIFFSSGAEKKLPVTQIVKIYNTSKATVIKWTPVKKASGYNVYRKTSSSEWKHIAYVDGGESKKFTDNSVRTMKEYFYCVKAVRGKTVGEPSDVKAYKFIPPTYITSVTGTDDGVEVCWTAGSRGGYNIYRKSSGGKWKIIAAVSNPSQSSFTDKNVKSGVKYTYTVRRTSGDYLSAYDTKGKSVVFAASPGSISVRNSPNGVTVTWEKVGGAKKYRIYRKIDGEKKYKRIATVKTATPYIDRSVKYGKKNTYHVRAVLDSKNTSEKTENVFLYAVNPNRKMVALTYDDGPYDAVTNRILNTLEKYNGRATFFVVGSRLYTYRNTLNREVSLGCELGNHTYNHTILTSASASEIKNEISLTTSKIKEYTGYNVKLVRAPGGAVNQTVKDNVSYPLVNWSVDTLDWKYRDRDSVIANVKSNVRDGSIILMHDLYSSTGDAATVIIPWLTENGYQLVTVSELLETRGISPVKGNLYCNAYK